MVPWKSSSGRIENSSLSIEVNVSLYQFIGQYIVVLICDTIANLLEVRQKIVPAPSAARIESVPGIVICSRTSGPDHAIQYCAASNGSSLIELSGSIVEELLWCRREIRIVDCSQILANLVWYGDDAFILVPVPGITT